MALQSGGGQNDLYFSAELQDNVTPAADQIEKKLKDLGASKSEIKMFLTAYDQATPQIKAAHEQLNKLPKQQMINIQTNAGVARKAFDDLKRAVAAPITVTMHVKDDFDNYVTNLKARAMTIETRLKQALSNTPMFAGLIGATGSAYNFVAAPLSTMTGLPFSSLGVGAAGLGASGAIGAFMTKSFEANANLEQQMAQLTQVMRTPSAAQAAYQQVTKTAQTTPFNQPDVLASYIQMAQMGTNPTNKAYGIKASANLAAGAQVPISQATGALQNASLGYFESFNNLTGRNIRQTDFTYGGRYSGQTYEQAVLAVLKQYQGASQTQMQTFKGLMTNIQDVITQKVIIPGGQPLFGALKGMEQKTASTLQSPHFQLQLSQEVDKLQVGLIKVFQLVQKGKDYFVSSIEEPLKQITHNLVQVGAAFGKAFGGATLTAVKYLSEAFTTILAPVSKLVAAIPQIGQVAGLLKALHMMGISTSTGAANFFGGISHLNIGETLHGLSQFTSLLGKIGLYFTVKTILDMKNANDQLNHSFQGLGKQGGDALDGLKVKFDSLILKASAFGASVSQLKDWGAGVASTIGPSVGTSKLSQSAYFGGQAAMRLSSVFGKDMGPTLDTWLNVVGATGKIRSGQTSPQHIIDKTADQITRSGEYLSQVLGVDLKTAAQDAVVGLQLFSKQLTASHMYNPRGDAGITALAGLLGQKHALTAQDIKAFGTSDPNVIVKDLIQGYTAPSVSQLRQALHNKTFNQTWAFNATQGYSRPDRSMVSDPGVTLPNLGRTAGIMNILRPYQQIGPSNQAAQQQIMSMIGPAAGSMLHIQLPQFSNPLTQQGPMGLGSQLGPLASMNAGQIGGLTAKQTAQDIVRVQDALNQVQIAIQNVNQQITKYNDQSSRLSIVNEEAAASVARVQLAMHGMQNTVDQLSLQMQILQTNVGNPLQHALAAASQAMANFEQNAILPVQHAQDIWNQTMLLTSNRLEDVSFSMQKAQFNMEKFNGGMLIGENALTANIEALTIYNEKLQMLSLMNMGLQADLTRTQIHQGFTSTVQPLMGFDLQREIQLGQERQQLAQAQYDTTYGYQHWKLQRAARTQFQKQEMTFAQRMSGTKAAAATLSAGTVETMAIQIQQYHEQLQSRKLEQQMFDLQKQTWPLQQKAFDANLALYKFEQYTVYPKTQQIATDTNTIATKLLPVQEAQTKVALQTQITQTAIDLKLLGLNESLGKLQNSVPDLRQLQKELSSNFDKSIKAGPTPLMQHLQDIAKNTGGSWHLLGLIAQAFRIPVELGGGSPSKGAGGAAGSITGGGPTPPVNLPAYKPLGSGLPGFFGIVKNILTTLTNPIQAWGTALDAASNSVSKLTGSNALGKIAGIGAAAAAVLATINAFHLIMVHTTGKLGSMLAGHALDKIGGINELVGAKGFDSALLRMEYRFGTFLSNLREGQPLLAGILHPSLYLRTQAPETAARAAIFGAGTALGHPIPAFMAANYVGEKIGQGSSASQWNRGAPIYDEQGNITGYERGSYRQFVATKAISRFMIHPRATMSQWFSKMGDQAYQDANNMGQKVAAAADESGLTKAIQEAKTTLAKPGFFVLLKGKLFGGSMAAPIASGDPLASPTTTTRVPLTDLAPTDQAAADAAALADEERATADTMKAASSTFSETAKTLVTNLYQTTKTFVANLVSGEKTITDAETLAARAQYASARLQEEAARKAAVSAGKIEQAAQDGKKIAAIEETAAKTSKESSSLYKTVTNLFHDHVASFGNIGTRIGTAWGKVVSNFGDHVSTWRSAVSDVIKNGFGIFKDAIKPFTDAIKPIFTNAVDAFKFNVDGLGKTIINLEKGVGKLFSGFPSIRGLFGGSHMITPSGFGSTDPRVQSVSTQEIDKVVAKELQAAATAASKIDTLGNSAQTGANTISESTSRFGGVVKLAGSTISKVLGSVGVAFGIAQAYGQASHGQIGNALLSLASGFSIPAALIQILANVIPQGPVRPYGSSTGPTKGAFPQASSYILNLAKQLHIPPSELGMTNAGMAAMAQSGAPFSTNMVQPVNNIQFITSLANNLKAWYSQMKMLGTNPASVFKMPTIAKDAASNFMTDLSKAASDAKHGNFSAFAQDYKDALAQFNVFKNQYIGQWTGLLTSIHGLSADSSQQRAAMQKTFDTMSLKQQQSFVTTFANNAADAQQALLSGPQGAKTYLADYQKLVHSGFGKLLGAQKLTFSQLSDAYNAYYGLSKDQQKTFNDAFQKDQGAAFNAMLSGQGGLQGFLSAYGRTFEGWQNAKLRLAAEAATKEAGVTNSGYQAIAGATTGWLNAIQKLLFTWEKNNNVKLTQSQATALAVIMPNSVNMNVAGAAVSSGALAEPSIVGASSFAHGGVVEADKYKVGPGRVVRMVEEGHPEVVIPLAPHRRERARSLVKQTQSMLAMASGGYVDPVPGWSPSRIDQGVDGTLGPAGYLAPGLSKVIEAISYTSGWKGGWISAQLLDGQYKGRNYYAAEGVAPASGVTSGATIKAGRQLGRIASAAGWGNTPGTIETGWSDNAGASTLAQSLPGYAGDQSAAAITAGESFNAFLMSLGAAGGHVDPGAAAPNPKLLKGYPWGKAGAIGAAISVPPIHLPGPPNLLKQLGVVGPKMYAVLNGHVQSWQKQINQKAAAASPGGTAGSGIYKFGATPSGGYTPTTWAQALLKGMKIPSTNQDVLDILAWEQAEGGNWNNSARYNPLNTTQQEPGSTVMGGGSSAGVQAYTSWAQGLIATAQTLNNGSYAGILSALRAGNDSVSAFGQVVGASPWGTAPFANGGTIAALQGYAGGGTVPAALRALPALPPLPNIPYDIQENLGKLEFGFGGGSQQHQGQASNNKGKKSGGSSGSSSASSGPAGGGTLVGASEYNDTKAAYSPYTNQIGSIARLQSGGSTWWNQLAEHSKWRISANNKSFIGTVQDWGTGGGTVAGLPRVVDLWWKDLGLLGLPMDAAASAWGGAVKLEKAAGGIPRVPRDDYLALLHQGETVVQAGTSNMMDQSLRTTKPLHHHHGHHGSPNPAHVNPAQILRHLDQMHHSIQKALRTDHGSPLGFRKGQVKEIHHAIIDVRNAMQKVRDDIQNHKGPKQIAEDMRKAREALEKMHDLQKHDYIQSVFQDINNNTKKLNAQLKSSIDSAARHFGEKARHEIHGGQSPFGTGTEQTSNEAHNLINKLHNIPITKHGQIHYISLQTLLTKAHQYHTDIQTESQTMATITQQMSQIKDHTSKKYKHLAHELKHESALRQKSRKQYEAEKKKIHQAELQFIKTEEKAGVPRDLIMWAIKNVGMFDNQGLYSDAQLNAIPPSLYKRARHYRNPSASHAHPDPSSIPGHHHHAAKQHHHHTKQHHAHQKNHYNTTEQSYRATKQYEDNTSKKFDKMINYLGDIHGSLQKIQPNVQNNLLVQINGFQHHQPKIKVSAPRNR